MAEWVGGPIMSAVAMANATSDYIRLQGYDGAQVVSFHCTSPSNTHVGTLAVQISNDLVNWVAVTLSTGASTVAVEVNTAVNAFIDIIDTGAQYMRMVYVNTSGDGVLTITPHGRGL